MAKHSLGWIGMGRMGYPMAERLLKAGHSVAIWNRTRAKAEPLAKKGGADRRSAERACRPGHRVHDGVDGQGSRAGLFRRQRPRRRRLRPAAENPGRLLLDRGRAVGGDPRAAEATGLRIRQLPGQRQRQDASRPASSPRSSRARRRRSSRCSLISRPSRPPASPMSARANWRASARSRTTSSSASSSRTSPRSPSWRKRPACRATPSSIS